MSQKRIGILRGGTGRHYKTSLQKGGDVILYITENLAEKYKPVDILIDKDYIWHCGGVPVNPGDLMHKVDVVWNLSHPSFSNILDSLSIPNIGVGAFLSTLLGNRQMFREHVKNIGINMPRHIVLPVYQKDFDGPREKYSIKKAKEIFEKFGSPWIVKSFIPDSTMGAHLAKTFPELVNAIEDGVNHEQSIIVEEFIAGKIASTHSVDNFRGDPPALSPRQEQAGGVYVFPITDSAFSSSEKEKLAGIVKDLRKHISVKHYLKSDFILHPQGKIYLTHIELNPDLKPDSHFSEICKSVGVKPCNVVEHILERAL